MFNLYKCALVAHIYRLCEGVEAEHTLQDMEAPERSLAFFLDSETTLKISLFLLIKVRVIHMRLPSVLNQERFTTIEPKLTNWVTDMKIYP